MVEEDDPYSKLYDSKDNVLEAPKQESARERKWKKLVTKMSEAKMQAKQGFIMGALVKIKEQITKKKM